MPWSYDERHTADFGREAVVYPVKLGRHGRQRSKERRRAASGGAEARPAAARVARRGRVAEFEYALMFARATVRGAPELSSASFALPPSLSSWSRSLCLFLVDERDGRLCITQAYVMGPWPPLAAIADYNRIARVAFEGCAGADVLQMVSCSVSRIQYGE